METLRVIRQREASQIEAIWNPNKDNLEVTAKYVLFNNSLRYFRRIGTRVDNLFNKGVCTKNEYCIKYKEYYLVNDYLLKIEQDPREQDEVNIRLVDRTDFHTLRYTSVNKYILSTYANLYGYGVRNSTYLAAFKMLYRMDRDIESVYSYNAVITDGTIIHYIPYSKIVFADGSIEQYRGTEVVDDYRLSNFCGKIQLNTYYGIDLLEGKKYRKIGGEISIDKLQNMVKDYNA